MFSQRLTGSVFSSFDLRTPLMRLILLTAGILYVQYMRSQASCSHSPIPARLRLQPILGRKTRRSSVILDSNEKVVHVNWYGRRRWYGHGRCWWRKWIDVLGDLRCSSYVSEAISVP